MLPINELQEKLDAAFEALKFSEESRLAWSEMARVRKEETDKIKKALADLLK